MSAEFLLEIGTEELPSSFVRHALGAMRSAAVELINASSITALFVVENGRPVGIIHIHDLLRAGVA